MGADKRLFSEIKPIEGYEFIDLEWQLVPNIKTLGEYAQKISEQIDTSQPFSLLGVSMGGMVCVELAEILNPENTVIISSAKSNLELPSHLKRLRFIAVNGLLRGSKLKTLLNNSARFFGAMNSKQKELFYLMAGSINIDLIAWSIKAIMNWDRKIYPKNIIHLHGTNDIILPASNIKNAELINKGDHMMIWSKAGLINEKLQQIFKG